MRTLFSFLLFIFLGIQLQAQQQVKLSDLQGFAQEIEAGMNNLDAGFLKDKLDLEIFLNKILLAGEQHKDLDDFNRGAKKSMSSQMNFGQNIVQEIQKGASFEFLKAGVEHRKGFIIFRMYSPENGLNYQKYLITGRAPNFKIEDIYLYSSAEYLSNMMKSYYLLSLYNLGVFSDSEKFKQLEYEAEFFSDVSPLLNEEKYQELEQRLSTLSPDLQQKKIFMMMKLQIASNKGIQEYAATLQEFKQFYPNDPRTGFVGYGLLFFYKKSMTKH